MPDRKDHKGRKVPQDAPTTRETPEERGARIGREAAERLAARPTEQLRIQAQGNEHSFHAEVGPWDPHKYEGRGGFEFGMTAEVYRSRGYGADEQNAEVSFPAIGSHSPEVASRRLASYQEAILIATYLNLNPDITNEQAAKRYDGETR